jgi:hypothetical protein
VRAPVAMLKIVIIVRFQVPVTTVQLTLQMKADNATVLVGTLIKMVPALNVILLNSLTTLNVMTVQIIAQHVQARLDNAHLVLIQPTISQTVFAHAHLTTILLTIRQVIALNSFTVAKENTTMDGILAEIALNSALHVISSQATVTCAMRQPWKK